MGTSPGYLLDTNVLVGLIRGNDLGKHIDAKFSLQAALGRCMISIVSAGEMRSLAMQFGWGDAKVQSLMALLDELTMIDISREEILAAYAEIDHASKLQGRKMGKNDVWIAATAKVVGATLLTTDRDFDHLQGRFIDRIWIDESTAGAT